MNESDKIKMLEELLEVDEGSLLPETLLEDVDSFDSMAKLSLIVLFDDEFGKKLTGDQIKGFSTIGDILAAMD